MRYLANENIPLETIEILKREGVEIISIIEISQGAKDEEVVKISQEQKRIIITFDKDYGESVFRKRLKTEGVILLRFPPKSPFYITEKLKKDI